MQWGSIKPWLAASVVPSISLVALFFWTAPGRRAAHEREAFIAEKCPGFTSYEDCARQEQAKADDARNLVLREQEEAMALDRARGRAQQNADPREIDSVLHRTLEGAKKIQTLWPRCGPQLKGQSGWDQAKRDLAAELDRGLDSDVLGDMLPRQKRTYADLREAFGNAAKCGRCSEESKQSCLRMRAAIERAEKDITAK